MQFNIIFKTLFEYIHKKFCFMHTNMFCKYRKKLLASPRVHLVIIVYVCCCCVFFVFFFFFFFFCCCFFLCIYVLLCVSFFLFSLVKA